MEAFQNRRYVYILFGAGDYSGCLILHLYRKCSGAASWDSVSQQALSGLSLTSLSKVKYITEFHGGFSYDAFNARAMLQPWTVLRIFECSRTVGWWRNSSTPGEDSLMKLDKITCLPFTAATTVQFEPEIYNVHLEKRPLTVENELVQIGRTSFKYKSTMHFPGHNTPLVEVFTQFVFVDPNSRKPSPLPDWWRQEFSEQLSNKEEKGLRISPLLIPDGVEIFEDNIRVLPSDIDPYMHTNWAQFTKFSLDLYTLWRATRPGHTNHGDTFRKVKSALHNYKGEVNLGDVLDVKFWSCPENINMFSFIFTKKSDIVHECTLEFFSI